MLKLYLQLLNSKVSVTVQRKSLIPEILFWCIIALSGSLILYGGNPFHNLEKFFLFLPDLLLAFYVPKYVLYPKYYKKNKIFKFTLLSIITIVAISIFHSELDLYTWRHKILADAFPICLERHYIMTLWIISGMYFCSFGFSLWAQKQEQEIELKTLLENRVKNELLFLQNQIHPHFLLNTLNNLYVLTLEKSSKTPATILKLADLLRYLTYECENNFTSLSRELEALGNYLDLMQVKHQDELNITIKQHIKNKELQIPNNILFPLLENAFKHSNIGYEDDSFISITILEDYVVGHLSIEIENSVAKKFEKMEFGGLGLTNVEKRLQLLYPNRNILHTQNKGDTYYCELNFPATTNTQF